MGGHVILIDVSCVSHRGQLLVCKFTVLEVVSELVPRLCHLNICGLLHRLTIMICGYEARIFSVRDAVICFPRYKVCSKDSIENCPHVAGYERRYAFCIVVPPFY